MKLISWNCQGAFRNKAEYILSENPDILIIQECEHLDKLKFGSKMPKPNDFLWFGDNKHKGLAIFSFSEAKFKVKELHNEDFKYVIPVIVTGLKQEFTLYAIWANNKNDRDGQYIEQVWKAINYYESLLTKEQSILIGDFNSNKIWDKVHRTGNHSHVVDKLEAHKIYSIYHKMGEQEQGKEIHPTFFLQRNRNKPYHIDYCFASSEIYNNAQNIEIGSFEKWITFSDHIPLIINFNF